MQGPGSNSQSNTASSKRQPLTCTHARDRLNGEGGGFGSFDFTSVTYPDPSLTSSPTRANSAAPAPYNSATRTPVSRPLEYGPPAASTSSVHDQPARPANEPQAHPQYEPPARPQYESTVAVAPRRDDLEAILSEKDAVIKQIRADSSKRRDELYDTKSKLAVAEEKIRAHEANIGAYEKHAEEDNATIEQLTSKLRTREEEIVQLTEKKCKELADASDAHRAEIIKIKDEARTEIIKAKDEVISRLESASKEQQGVYDKTLASLKDHARADAQEAETLKSTHAREKAEANVAHDRETAELRTLLAQAATELAQAMKDSKAEIAQVKAEVNSEMERKVALFAQESMKAHENLRSEKDIVIAGLKDGLSEMKVKHAVCESQLACLKASSVAERNYCVAVAKLNTGFKDKTAVERITRQCQEAVAQVASEYMEDDEARTAAEDPHAEEAESKSGGNLSEPGQADGAANLADGAAAKTN